MSQSNLDSKSPRKCSTPSKSETAVHISHISNNIPEPSFEPETLTNLQNLQKFITTSSKNDFAESPNHSLFNLSYFPDFFKDFLVGDDICQNFTFLKLYQLSHKMSKFCDKNISRLEKDSDSDSEIVQTLIANLQISKLKVQRLLRFTISKVIRALSIYSGFFKLYDKFIFRAVEAMNKLICEWYGDCLKTVSKFQFLENKFFSIFNFKYFF